MPIDFLLYCAVILIKNAKDTPPIWNTKMTSRSQQFLNDVQVVIESHLNETTFSVAGLSRFLGISESTLRRKVLQITGLKPNHLIRQIRLQKAAEMLANDVASISEISGSVGFGDAAYFSKSFQEQFGILPSAYRRKFFIEKSTNFHLH